MNAHCHSFFELHISICGEAAFLIDGREYVLTPNTFLLLPPQKHHRMTRISPDFERFVWGFSVENQGISKKLAEKCGKIAVRPAPQRVMDAVEIMLKNAGSDQYGSYQIVRNEMDYIFLILLRSLTLMRNEKSISLTKSTYRSEAVIRFLKDNMSGDPEARDAAGILGIGQRQLSRICENESGMSFQDMKVQVRMDRIRELLRTTDAPLDGIALRTGFADRYSLSKFFKKWEGISPVSYRKACTNN